MRLWSTSYRLLWNNIQYIIINHLLHLYYMGMPFHSHACIFTCLRLIRICKSAHEISSPHCTLACAINIVCVCIYIYIYIYIIHLTLIFPTGLLFMNFSLISKFPVLQGLCILSIDGVYILLEWACDALGAYLGTGIDGLSEFLS